MHWMNDPINRRMKRDSKSNRRKRPPGVPVYKKGAKSSEQETKKAAKKKGK